MTKVNVTEIFDRIMSGAMQHMIDAHGEQAMHRLFFELYDHTFSFLDREFGYDAVKAYWEYISDNQLTVLEELMKTKGFAGMKEYFGNTCGQEGADIEIEVTEDSYKAVVKHCPPMEWFKSRGIDHYPKYCEHCDTLYRRVAERCGFEMEYIAPDEEAGHCCGAIITRKKADA